MKKIFQLSLMTLLLMSEGFTQDNLSDGWHLSVGAGALYTPAFTGSDQYQLSTVPSIRVRYGNAFFASVEQGIGYNAIRKNGWKIGPIGRYQFSRREGDGGNPFRISGDNITALDGLGDVDGTFELGGFAAYSQREFSLRAEVRQGLNGHEGMIGDFNANLNVPIFNVPFNQTQRPTILAFGPRATMVDSNYNQAYFGVNAVQSANSGLRQYNAKAGLLSYGLGATLIIPITDRVTSTIFTGYDRLTGDAGDAPLVQNRGSQNQAVAGAFLSYALY
ncbi:MAG: outer membrane protein [Alphaproteobacteria bacterium]|jgi:outer membrane protein